MSIVYVSQPVRMAFYFFSFFAGERISGKTHHLKKKSPKLDSKGFFHVNSKISLKSCMRLNELTRIQVNVTVY